MKTPQTEIAAILAEMAKEAFSLRVGAAPRYWTISDKLNDWADRLAVLSSQLQRVEQDTDTRVGDTQYPTKPLATASENVLVPRALIATTVMESERQKALRWRDGFLNDDGPGTIAPLDPQIVAYLIEDHETLQKISSAAFSEMSAPRQEDEQTDQARGPSGGQS
jgi:hypothetical protein